LQGQYGLRRKAIAYVKNIKFEYMTIALKSITRCEVLGLDENIQCTCFGHDFFKACQYATIDKKVCRNFRFVLIKSTQ
jgi:hypothetical protein